MPNDHVFDDYTGTGYGAGDPYSPAGGGNGGASAHHVPHHGGGPPLMKDATGGGGGGGVSSMGGHYRGPTMSAANIPGT